MIETIKRVEITAEYAKALVVIAEIYGDALVDIIESEVCCSGGANLKSIAQNAVVRAFQLTQTAQAQLKKDKF